MTEEENINEILSARYKEAHREDIERQRILDRKEDFKFLAAMFVHAQLSNPNKMSGTKKSQREVIETAINIAHHLLIDLGEEDK